jgi:hypothetical protein
MGSMTSGGLGYGQRQVCANPFFITIGRGYATATTLRHWYAIGTPLVRPLDRPHLLRRRFAILFTLPPFMT